MSLWEHTHLANITHDKPDGSERECEEPMILRRFAENEEFGLERGQSLCLEQKVTERPQPDRHRGTSS